MTELWCIGKPIVREKPKRGTWRFCEVTLNGKTYCSIEHHEHGGSKEPVLGTATRIDLTEDQKDMSLDVLTSLFRQKKVPPDTPSWDRDPVLRAKMIEAIARIIMESREKGERDNARALYEKLTGVKFNG